MGNHRDAWVFGAVDPNSGTAGLMEIARVAGLLRKNSEWLPLEGTPQEEGNDTTFQLRSIFK